MPAAGKGARNQVRHDASDSVHDQDKSNSLFDFGNDVAAEAQGMKRQ